MQHYWNLRTTLSGDTFLKSSIFTCPYIIHNNNIYDIRLYSYPSGGYIIPSYLGYILIARCSSLKAAKNKVRNLFNKEKGGFL